MRATVHERNFVVSAQRAAELGRGDDPSAPSAENHNAFPPVAYHGRKLFRTGAFKALARAQCQTAYIPQALLAPQLLLDFAVFRKFASKAGARLEKEKQETIGEFLEFLQ